MNSPDEMDVDTTAIEESGSVKKEEPIVVNPDEVNVSTDEMDEFS